MNDLEPRIPCVGAIVLDDAGRLLLIRRANPPAQGLWSLPGGRVQAGESSESAVVRELLEETGLVGTVGAFVGEVQRAAPTGGVYVIRDYRVEITGSATPTAGDDALAARWVTAAELHELETSPGLVEALTDWDVQVSG